MNLKTILPFENYKIITNLKPEKIVEKLIANVKPKREISFSFKPVEITKPYQGEVYKTGFKINRCIDYRNSFLPEITGTFSTFLGKTEVNISMRLFTLVKVFAILWLSVVGVVCIGIIFGYIFFANNLSKIQFSPAILIPFGMFIFGCLLFTLPFKIESKKAKEFLDKLFEAL